MLGTHSAEELREADWVVGSLEEVRVGVVGDSLRCTFYDVR